MRAVLVALLLCAAPAEAQLRGGKAQLRGGKDSLEAAERGPRSLTTKLLDTGCADVEADLVPCAAHWTSTDGGDCGNVQEGCPATSCYGNHDPWCCTADNAPGSCQNWRYCDPACSAPTPVPRPAPSSLPTLTSVPTGCDPWEGVTMFEGKKGGAYGPFEYTFDKGKNAVGPFYGEQDFLLNPTTAPVISNYDQDREDHCPAGCNGCYIIDSGKSSKKGSSSSSDAGPEGTCRTDIDRCTCLAQYGTWTIGGKKGNEMYWCAGLEGGEDECAPCDVCCKAAFGQDCSAGPSSHVGDNNCYDPFEDKCVSGKKGYDTPQLCYENGKGKYLWCSGDADTACPTPAPPTGCVENEGDTFSWDKKTRTCSWLSKKPTRCAKPKALDARTVCPVTCKTCYETQSPTPAPSGLPLPAPSALPLPAPTGQPLPAPTGLPLPAPTSLPLPMPTALPLPAPTAKPTAEPTPTPTLVPLPVPSALPLPAPTALACILTDDNIHEAVQDYLISDGTNFGLGPIGDWPTSCVTDFAGLFCNAGAPSATSICGGKEKLGAATFNADISKWDTASATTMRATFYGAYAFNNCEVDDMLLAVPDYLDNNCNDNPLAWNMQSVTDASYMFAMATSFDQLFPRYFDLGKVTSMRSMFDGASTFNRNIGYWFMLALEDTSYMFRDAISFNHIIGGITGITGVWNMGSVTSTRSMFAGASDFTNGDDGGPLVWDTSALKDASSMFRSAERFNQEIGFWNMASVTDTSRMFEYARAFDQPIGYWIMASVTDTSRMFSGAERFNQDISSWYMQSVTDTSRMFEYAFAFDQFIGEWNMGSVTDMSEMFAGASDFTNGDDGGPLVWNTSALKDASGMFRSAELFNQEIGFWNMASVTDTSNMFEDARAFDQPIGFWNMASVTDTSWMFSGAERFNQEILFWNMASVTDTSNMFKDARAFDQPIGFWIMANVTDTSRMFSGAERFNQEIGLWYMPSVTDTSRMFRGAERFNQEIGFWYMPSVTDTSRMFENTRDFDQHIGYWIMASVTDTSRMFDGARAFNNAGLPLSWNLLSLTEMSDMFYGAESFALCLEWVTTAIGNDSPDTYEGTACVDDFCGVNLNVDCTL